MANNGCNGNGNVSTVETDLSTKDQECAIQNLNLSTQTDAVAESELTLTDHLNKRLLNSFLQRINQMQPSASSSAVEPDSSYQEDFVLVDNVQSGESLNHFTSSSKEA
jgi:hypothetical protein